MARLVIKNEGLENQVLELRLGVNHIGRDPDCEFCIDHPTVSTLHCKLSLSNDGVYIQDCQSTNGTFVNGEPVMETWLDAGQTVHLGDVELLVESTDANIAIPKFEHDRPTPPVVLPDGAVSCKRHPQQQATYRCTKCMEMVCNYCIHIMKLKGGAPLFLCPLCSGRCEPVAGAPTVAKKKKGVAGFLDTVKLKFGFPHARKK